LRKENNNLGLKKYSSFLGIKKEKEILFSKNDYLVYCNNINYLMQSVQFKMILSSGEFLLHFLKAVKACYTAKWHYEDQIQLICCDCKVIGIGVSTRSLVQEIVSLSE